MSNTFNVLLPRAGWAGSGLRAEAIYLIISSVRSLALKNKTCNLVFLEILKVIKLNVTASQIGSVLQEWQVNAACYWY